MALAENTSNDSAQSPACSTNPRCSVTAASASVRLRASPANTSGGTSRKVVERAVERRGVGPVGLLRGRQLAPESGDHCFMWNSSPVVGRVAASALRGTRSGPRARRSPGRCARRRISSSCPCAIACWVNSVAWMPWNRPSSQPTSCACARRSSDSGRVVAGERQHDLARAPGGGRARARPRAPRATSRGSRAGDDGRRRRAARGAPRRAWCAPSTRCGSAWWGW